MVGIRLIIIMAFVGGFIAYLADKLGSKIGKKKMSVFGLRPKYTSILLTVLSGVMISTLSIVVVSISSESARTALFGMEKLQEELKMLNQEKEAASKALTDAIDNVKQQNQKISLLDKEIKSATDAKSKIEDQLAGVNKKYTSAENEVRSLSEAKSVLSKEIEELEKTTKQLRDGIAKVREGQLYYRAGELVYSGVLKGGLGDEENKEQLVQLLAGGNEAALQHLGSARPEKMIQIIWIDPAVVDEALSILSQSKGSYVCRMRNIANVMVGELVMCDLEIHPNKLVYSSGVNVHSAVYTEREAQEPDGLLMEFLAGVNRAAVNAGVLSDPVTGKVGNIDAEAMVTAKNAIKECNGSFELTAYAKSDVYTAGPVYVGLRIKSVK